MQLVNTNQAVSPATLILSGDVFAVSIGYITRWRFLAALGSVNPVETDTE
jgi:hypothetical protein